MFLLCIALGLTTLFLPHFFDRWFVQPSIEARRPQAAWFYAHPVAYIAAAIIRVVVQLFSLLTQEWLFLPLGAAVRPLVTIN